MPAAAEIAILAPRIVRESALPRRWRKRGAFAALAGLDDLGLLARAFRVDTSSLAAAPLHYLGMTGDDPAGYCLFAYPVYLHARREQLILMTGPEFELNEAEARSLAATLREHFPDWRVERTPDAMWFIIMDRDPELETTPLQEVLGENIDGHLPRGGDAMAWHRILNEIQMLLFESEVNRNREAAGRPPVNSLWFWGGGRLPDIKSSLWTRVMTNNPVAGGMGRAAGIETHWLDQAPGQGTPESEWITEPGTLWVYSRPAEMAARQPVVSVHQWRILRDSLRHGALDKLVLIEPEYGELTIDSRTAASWWPW